MKLATSPNKFPTPTAGGEASTLKAATALDQDPSLVASRPGKAVPQGATKIGVWTRVSSFSFAALLLAAAPSHAAGVCIVCPPGHACPANGAPVISGTPGQVLTRTASGMEWMDMGTTGNNAGYRIRSHRGGLGLLNPFARGSSGDHSINHCWCRKENATIPGQISSSIFVGRVSHQPAGEAECQTRCETETAWRARARWTSGSTVPWTTSRGDCPSAQLSSLWGASGLDHVERQNLAFDIEWSCGYSSTQPPSHPFELGQGTGTPGRRWCWCRAAGGPADNHCASSWVFLNQAHDVSTCAHSCMGNCASHSGWRHQTSW